MDHQVKDHVRFNNSSLSNSGDVFEPSSSNAKQRATLIEWLNRVLPDLSLPINASDEELRGFLVDGTVLCRILNKLKPGSVTELNGSAHSSHSCSENVQRFLSAMDVMELPRFQAADLEKGSMKIVLDCLLTLQTQFKPNVGRCNGSDASKRWKLIGERVGSWEGSRREDPFRALSSPTSEERRRVVLSDSKFQRALRSPTVAEPSAALINHVGHKFHEVFQLKQGSYTDLSPGKLSEMMKSNSLDNAPTQSLLSVVNGILDESIERKNGEIPHRVACLLRKVVQEIERRISTQAEHLRTQNNLFKARDDKYQSRIRVLEALATGTGEETQMVMNQLQHIKNEKNKIEERKKVEEQDAIKLMKEKDDHNEEIAALKQELDIARKTYEQRCLQMETESGGSQQELEERLKEVGNLLTESRNKVKVLEASSQSKSDRWNKKEQTYRKFTEFQLGALRELRTASQSIQQEIVRIQKSYSEEFGHLGTRMKALEEAAKSYYSLLAENQKLHNELQELKGNIRVYCRIRPFLPGQTGKQSIIEYIGENGELVVLNPSKQGKEGRRSFKFNKVYGPTATQAEVFVDTQPLIQSVLDGFNVCIFAYGQTGSGKTYTMTGPDGATEKDWGVNYRALNDLFHISQVRKSTFTYEISVQMMEIYNEQVRDLLSSDAVPDASIQVVNSPSDVLELMDTGLKNRARSSTALNERSSRSHSIVTIHARAVDLKSGSSLHGSLHLVDLAGSERVDRSEVTGDRLKEAQHINKSLSALGDVISALAQKSAHVPYRNSKLTQVLQSSLGGHAKTLMFVQLNPDVTSCSESISTLKFAERVSGVELGAAKSSKDGRDVRELMEQVASLKDTIAKKDEEIERLQLLKDLKNVSPSLRYGSTSPSKNSTGGTPQRSFKMLKGLEKAASDEENYSEGSDKHYINSFRKESTGRSSTAGENIETEESSRFPEEAKQAENTDKPKSAARIPRPLVKSTRESPKAQTELRKSASATNLTSKSSRRWQ
ncbi:P-loop nucleoside triphosphate hydrolase superfamily protein with CH (Calponin-like proteiny) domain [Forsythia ovata]|uniref:P-loop nucleoside triphosphate hydrolase superfamily protein with CH (Calponin-like proteiny) domain n=1 Tax=Forsythia ovata TaxID=205694 RepID=A0ABD1QV47_9LAMI